jgi:hypothetical protein
MQLYQWDSGSQTWSGPSALDSIRVPRRLLASLLSAPGGSWYGRVKCDAAEQTARFFVLMHALHDCVLALIYCDDSKSGPAEIVVAVPPQKRKAVRPDFAFELVSFARFLGGLDEGGALKVHDLISAAIADSQPDDALIFSISTGLWSKDLDYLLSNCVEKVATAALEWVAER